MSEEEINEALKIIKEPITVNSIEYKYFNQENYEKLLSVYENAKWFVSNWEQALQNIKDLQQRVEQLEKENEKLRDKIVELQGYKEAIYEIKKYIDAYSPYFLETQEQNNQTIAIIIDNIGNLGDK